MASSPISAKSLSQGLRLQDCSWDVSGQSLVWGEGRSDRGVLVHSALDGNAPRDLTDEISVRAQVGYGGGDFCVGDQVSVFCANQRLYRLELTGGKPRPITPSLGATGAMGAVASPRISPDGRWVLYVWSHERRDGLAVVDIEGDYWPQIVSCGHDFYMQPRWSSDGRYVAWVAWNHPNMPWNGTELFLAEVFYSDDGPPVFKNVQAVAGGSSVAVFQPEFSPDSRRIVWLSDETGWHNFYARDLKSGTTRQLTQENKAQLGTPAWLQGARTYGFSHDGRQIHFLRNERGFSTLCSLDGRSGKISVDEELKKEYSDLKQIACNPKDGRIALIASSGTCPARVIVLCATGGLPTSASAGLINALGSASEAARNSEEESASCNRTGGQNGISPHVRHIIIVKRSSSESAPKNELITPCAISWKGPRSTSIHGLLYLPKSIGESSGKKNAPKPPAIIRIHGGPTTQATAAYSGDIQFFVTRGYTVLDVNYRGSTGYGRKYMDELRGNWGVCDVQDAMSGAKFLIQRQWADAKKMVIMGGSAGGYTVLQSLVDSPGFYKAGVCLYGISNQFTLVSDTHKFEERYSDYLLGSLPEAAVKYRDRSPVFKSERIVDPVAVFQGEIDEVVPKSQSEAIVASLKTRNVPHEYHVYAGEGHGWRKSETIESFYKSVEAFLKNNVLFS